MRSLTLLFLGLTYAADSNAPSEPPSVSSPWEQVSDLLQHIESTQRFAASPPAEVTPTLCYLIIDGRVQLETCGLATKWERVGEAKGATVEEALRLADRPDLAQVDPLSVLPCTVVKQAQLRRPAHSLDTSFLVATISAQ